MRIIDDQGLSFKNNLVGLFIFRGKIFIRGQFLSFSLIF